MLCLKCPFFCLFFFHFPKKVNKAIVTTQDPYTIQTLMYLQSLTYRSTVQNYWVKWQGLTIRARHFTEAWGASRSAKLTLAHSYHFGLNHGLWRGTRGRSEVKSEAKSLNSIVKAMVRYQTRAQTFICLSLCSKRAARKVAMNLISVVKGQLFPVFSTVCCIYGKYVSSVSNCI